MLKNRKTFMILVTVMALLSLTVGMVTASEVPWVVNYQGMLTDAAGNPLTGTYEMTFRLYDVETAGSPLYSVGPGSITVDKGLFTQPLGILYADGRELWLGITVGSDPEMTPRQALRPVPYALSLAPGAKITGSNTGLSNPVLQIGSLGPSFARTLSVISTGNDGNAIFVSGSGERSPAVYSMTTGNDSNAIFGSSTGPNSYGVYGIASQDGVCGVAGGTTGSGSPGVMGSASGSNSPGVKGSALHGNGVEGTGQGVGVLGNATLGVGVRGDGLWGVYGRSTDVTGYGVKGESYNIGVQGVGLGDGFTVGVHGVSTNGYGIVGATDRADGKWGFFTDDLLWAGGAQYPPTDVAEYMQIAESVTPGTVLVIGKGGVLQASTTAYDTHVAGIVSTKPGVVLGANKDGNPGEAQIAVAGKVPCKVDASNGPILEGDLLTTSDNPGYAMKATNPQIGTILGKAMGSLERGTGTIEVLVTLQ